MATMPARRKRARRIRGRAERQARAPETTTEHGSSLTLDRTDSATLTDATDQVDGFEKDMGKLVETDARGNKIIGGV